MRIPALRVKEARQAWSEYDNGPEPDHYYICTLPAATARRLAATATAPAFASLRARAPNEQHGPGATNAPLPIVASIVRPTTQRHGARPDPRCLLTIEDADGGECKIVVPAALDEPELDTPYDRLPAIEIIEGSERLLAARGDVALTLFDGLSLDQQGYLAWMLHDSIDVTSSRRSVRKDERHANVLYDRYPSLRTASWRIRGKNRSYTALRPFILATMLAEEPQSPLCSAIFSASRRGAALTLHGVARSLQLSFLRSTEHPPANATSGLFALASAQDGSIELPWTSAQQGVYLTGLLAEADAALRRTSEPWSEHLRRIADHIADKEDVAQDASPRIAFMPHSLLSTDHGMRAFLQTCNALSTAALQDIPFADWRRPALLDPDLGHNEFHDALCELAKRREIVGFMERMASSMAGFDWRTPRTPGLDSADQERQQAYAGSAGYRKLSRALLKHVAAHAKDDVGEYARVLAEASGAPG